LLIAGVLLLAVAALLGFVQERYRSQPEAFAHWRVVHSGGTAGAVQLLALSAVWPALAGDWRPALAVALGITAATWAFFLGPLARALDLPRLAATTNLVGALFALPAYLALPVLLL
jgi:hypothetical protein